MGEMTPVYELLVAPLVFALLARHAQRALGAGRAAVEILALVAYGFALERVSMSVFSSHEYGPGWRVAPLGVPLAVSLVWAALILSGLALAARLSLRSPLARAGAAALLGLSLDLIMEPVAAAEGLWRWTPPGAWLQVPLGNYVGWAVIVGVYAWGTERFSAPGSLLRQAVWRGLLSLVALASPRGRGARLAAPGPGGALARGGGLAHLGSGLPRDPVAGLPRRAGRPWGRAWGAVWGWCPGTGRGSCSSSPRRPLPPTRWSRARGTLRLAALAPALVLLPGGGARHPPRGPRLVARAHARPAGGDGEPGGRPHEEAERPALDP